MRTFLKWMLMGMCDVIPWVSGGTIAFITGIYDRLLDALNNLNKLFLTMVMRGQWKKAWSHIHGTFLCQVLWWILTAIVLFAWLVERWLQSYPIIVWSFFFGLLGASAVVIARTIPHKRVYWIYGVVWVIVGFWLTSLPLVQAEPSLLSTFGAGTIAIMAMILPGISGSYILLMLNHYRHIISVLTITIYGIIDAAKALFTWDSMLSREILAWLPRDMIVVFVLWAVIGLILFSKVLFWLKQRYYNALVSLLVWVMIGAIHTVWPWKETITTYTDRHGELVPLIQANTSPESVGSFFLAFSVALLWVWLMVGIVYLSGRLQNQKD